MKFVLRLKAVSECIGIRRATISYFKFKNGVIDLKNEEHPLKQFGKIKILENDIEVLGNTEKLVLGEDVFFYKKNIVKSLTKDETERVTLGVMLLPLNIAMKDYYTDAIKNGFMFDQWNGEFEYILGMMYELSENDNETAKKWYDTADMKGFKFRLK